MMLQMIGDKALDEIIAMIIMRMLAQAQLLPGRMAGLHEALRLQLLFEKWIGQTLIDKDFAGMRLLGNQRAGIVLSPGGRIIAQIARQGFFSPCHLGGRDDGCADTERYRSGLRSASTSAPWPPMECPNMDWRAISTGKCSASKLGNSSRT